MTTSTGRDMYLTASVSTASPARLVTMLYDRLVLDLGHAEQELRGGDRATGSARLLHAQTILNHLRATLDVEAWTAAPGLAALYTFLITELIGANIGADPDRVLSCRRLLEPLRDAWRDAGQAATTAPAPSPKAA